MGQIGNQLIKEIAPDDVADALDRLYCYHLVTFCWALGTGVRLEGQALFLLSDELAEVAEENLAAAWQLAGRVSELGGVVTIDPSAFVARSPAATLSALDTAKEVAPILRYALEQVRVALGAYGRAARSDPRPRRPHASPALQARPAARRPGDRPRGSPRLTGKAVRAATSVRSALQTSSTVRSRWRRRSGSARMSISTIFPPVIVKLMTDTGRPSSVLTTPAAPLTSAGCAE